MLIISVLSHCSKFLSPFDHSSRLRSAAIPWVAWTWPQQRKRNEENLEQNLCKRNNICRKKNYVYIYIYIICKNKRCLKSKVPFFIFFNSRLEKSQKTSNWTNFELHLRRLWGLRHPRRREDHAGRTGWAGAAVGGLFGWSLCSQMWDFVEVFVDGCFWLIFLMDFCDGFLWWICFVFWWMLMTW